MVIPAAAHERRRCRIAGILTVLLAASGIPARGEAPAKVGRPVRVVSIGFSEKPLDAVVGIVEREAARGADLIVLPETWTGHAAPETLEGKTISTIGALAKKYNTYIVCPIDRKDGSRRYNSAVLIDRRGRVAGVYDKVFPYWAEFDFTPPVDIGTKVPVFETDFGRIGFAICFDVNFPEVWQALADQGAELVVWPSAYSAGTSLQAHAINHHFYIVTSTLRADCLVYDITGEQLLYEKSKDVNVSRITLDLDRGIYHQNFNIEGRDKLLKEHPEDVVQEKWMDLEQWFVLKAKRPSVSARALARQYGMEELRAYLDRSRREIDKKRGWPFAEKVIKERTTR
jgi:predicted amidohydrolase